jgi:hypothetical protein
MKTSVKTTGRVRKLAGVVSRLLNQNITLFEHQNDKEFQLQIGMTMWPSHTLTIREAGLALELIIASIAAGAIKVGVMGFTLPSSVPISLQEQYRRDVMARFEKYVAMLTSNELYWCLRSMQNLLPANHPSFDHINATLKTKIWAYETHDNAWYAKAEQNVRYFICAYRDLAMVYMTTSKRFPG